MSFECFTLSITLKPFLSQVHVLKRMGGMQENCHTCRLLDVSNVKGMSQHYGNSSSLPSLLDPLCKNDLPKGRKGELVGVFRWKLYFTVV